MIPVALRPEPAAFDASVRRKGLDFLREKGFDLDGPLPPSAELAPHWRACLTDLHDAYAGICAYLCIYVERVTGGASVDHFVAKSNRCGLAYEWSNYRLACSTMNSRKREYADVLDPIGLAPNLIRLQLSTGRVYPAPGLPAQPMRIVEETIERLGLDDPQCRELRVRWYQYYLENQISVDFLKSKSPFVWHEAHRQGLL